MKKVLTKIGTPASLYPFPQELREFHDGPRFVLRFADATDILTRYAGESVTSHLAKSPVERLEMGSQMWATTNSLS